MNAQHGCGTLRRRRDALIYPLIRCLERRLLTRCRPWAGHGPPEWRHIIHSQAYANLRGKAYKATQAGLDVVAMMGTDELHVTGDWLKVFPEGRGVAQMKIKHGDGKASGEYTVGTVTG
ncbi:hypothetical protein [Streptomyces sp. NBC_01166]|uniref:hypothetical protein n=1 Tax=Streptomyces sp. NBC_01166 TaxID=2903755 RepID=UPI003869F400